MQTLKGYKVSASKVAWCTCGLSKNHPHCDGSHTSTDKKPIIETISEEKTVYICACGKSQNKPFCDESHTTTQEK